MRCGRNQRDSYRRLTSSRNQNLATVLSLAIVFGSLLSDSMTSQAAEWKPAPGPLLTRWAKDVSPEKVHPEYPRPQLVRPTWTNLNGLWSYAITPRTGDQPQKYDGEILVPFPVESSLSGVKKLVSPEQALWYRRSFTVKNDPATPRWILHFGASDWETKVWVNGQLVGEHRGGYDPFSCDITAALKADGDQELVVSVTDPTDASYQPRGKQIRKPHGIWYTPTTGLWQTVWLEPVAKNAIDRLEIVPDIDRELVRVTVWTPVAAEVKLTAYDKGQTVSTRSGRSGQVIELPVANPKLWAPGHPFLYDLKVAVIEEDQITDEVSSYFGMRKIALGNDRSGTLRLLLNNQPVFQYGPLDQGFWPDGLYTPPTDAALKYDLDITQQLGFNMVRKHVKVEPDRWYYHCDKMGLLVWQDMPSGDRYIGDKDPDITRSPESVQNFEAEWAEIIRDLGNHPSIVMWVPFNEGWGQFDTARIVDFTRKLDPSRLVNNASGWSDRNVGDVHDYHVYPGPAVPPPSKTRARVLGEFGGLGLPLEGHTWQGKDNWGYRSFTNKTDLQRAYLGLMFRMRPLIADGLSAAVYTQTTDVEIEVNGLMTYDREVLKFDAKVLAEAHRKLLLPPPKEVTLVPTSEKAPQTWSYKTGTVPQGWEKPDFDTSEWQSGPGGFGTPDTPGTVVKTEWKTPLITIRRTFDLKEVPQGDLALRVHHDEDAEVYLNGVLVSQPRGYTVEYVLYPLDEAARKALVAGKNTLAIQCKQTGGGQYIDAGIVSLQEQ